MYIVSNMFVIDSESKIRNIEIDSVCCHKGFMTLFYPDGLSHVLLIEGAATKTLLYIANKTYFETSVETVMSKDSISLTNIYCFILNACWCRSKSFLSGKKQMHPKD